MDSLRTPVPVTWPATVELVNGPTSRVLRAATVESDEGLIALLSGAMSCSRAALAEAITRGFPRLLVRVRAGGGDVAFRACKLDLSLIPGASPKWEPPAESPRLLSTLTNGRSFVAVQPWTKSDT